VISRVRFEVFPLGFFTSHLHTRHVQASAFLTSKNCHTSLLNCRSAIANAVVTLVKQIIANIHSLRTRAFSYNSCSLLAFQSVIAVERRTGREGIVDTQPARNVSGVVRVLRPRHTAGAERPRVTAYRPKSIRCTCDGSKHGVARRVRKGQRWSAHLHGVGHDVRTATDLSAQGKGGTGLAEDPRSVPFVHNLCYTPRHLTSVNCQQVRIATRIVIYRGRIAIIDPRRSGCRIAIHDTIS
jgi:hypothetical protein